MSTIGARVRDGRTVRLAGNAAAEKISAAGPLTSDTPYWLLWSTGIAALVLGVAAFVLWGLNGAGTVFDLIAALCT